MRKFYFLAFIFAFVLSSAQTYSFDVLTKYNSLGKNNKIHNENVVYFNSDNFNYYLRLLRGQEYFYAYLFDNELNKVHEFNVIEKINGKEIVFSFEYVNSKKLIRNPISQKNFSYEWSESSNDVKILKIYKTRKAKKPNQEYQFSFKKSNKNLFPIFRISVMHPLEDNNMINIADNLIVEKARSICNNPPCSCDFRLADYKNVSLELVIPQ
ncbi:hypothetical protein [Kaistella sp.]|uniref:hypothetical protein n=2 Tax=Kaistella sp. TaxID=2782235 RepID=UPI002F91CAF4